MSATPWKYEFSKEQVEYLLKVLDLTQTRGEAQAMSLIAMISILRNPLNLKEVAEQAEPESTPAKEPTDS